MTRYFRLLLLLPLFCNAQTWQWGKRGGAFDEMFNGGGASLTNRREQVYSMATDSQRNVYVLSAVALTSLDIDGVPKTNFGDSNSKQDIALASFACDGTYRWSKIIGGGGQEVVPTLQVDADGNVYVAGKFVSNNYLYPPRIDDDVILTVDDQHSSMLFIVKYSPDGVMQWFKRPQPDDTPIENGLFKTRSFALAMDKNDEHRLLVSRNTRWPHRRRRFCEYIGT
ncbi:hypothetical protein [Flavobacterium sp. N1718]|uniref:hypothetical protein n=1 Tax=Flavobacterium sp. N1718 TaxID=2986822 RepID=UPI0022252BB9|nr:hypothetical protein [Flavobacterium sp. N1718]